MHEIELDAERQLVDQFLAEIMKQHPKATYGEMMIRSALERGAVDTLLLSEGLRKVRQTTSVDNVSMDGKLRQIGWLKFQIVLHVMRLRSSP